MRAGSGGTTMRSGCRFASGLELPASGTRNNGVRSFFGARRLDGVRVAETIRSHIRPPVLSRCLRTISHRCNRHSERTALLFASTSGRHLIESFWGSYVAILKDCVNGNRLVIRDCSGKIPCYVTSADDVDVVFSDVQDLDRLSIGATRHKLGVRCSVSHFQPNADTSQRHRSDFGGVGRRMCRIPYE